ncbi:MAG TPA: hypothetical protein EYG89_02790 [Bacteroidia bacterium]|nr:hypothetical protein [Bacteroidia bacterium]
MNIDKIPFKIGMQYENWEFDLDIIETERYDKYKYNKNDIDSLFQLAIQDIFLTFDLDILFKVEIVFKNCNSYEKFNYLLKQIAKTGQVLGVKKIRKNEVRIKWNKEENILELTYDIKYKFVSLLIVNKRYR